MGHEVGLLRRAPRGDRFQALHRRRTTYPRSRTRRATTIVVGILLVVSGAVLYPVPGPPSTLMILAGLALVAQEWVWAARRLDAIEVRSHAWFRRKAVRWKRLTRRPGR